VRLQRLVIEDDSRRVSKTVWLETVGNKSLTEAVGTNPTVFAVML